MVTHTLRTRRTRRTPLERSIQTSIRNADVNKQAMYGMAWITAIAASVAVLVLHASLEMGAAIFIVGTILTALWYRSS